MPETWFTWCVRHDGPKNKRGYFSVGTTRSLSLVEGEVKHSAEGRRKTMLDIIADPHNEKSWPLSIFVDGPPYQHYPLEDICWINDGPSNNSRFIGMEHEGLAGEPLNANQLQWTTRISQALRELCPKMAANPPARRVNLWEHREMAQTACPSGRIPWQGIIAALSKEDDVPTQGEWDAFRAAVDQTTANTVTAIQALRNDLTAFQAAVDQTTANQVAFNQRIVDALSVNDPQIDAIIAEIRTRLEE